MTHKIVTSAPPEGLRKGGGVFGHATMSPVTPHRTISLATELAAWVAKVSFASPPLSVECGPCLLHLRASWCPLPLRATVYRRSTAGVPVVPCLPRRPFNAGVAV